MKELFAYPLLNHNYELCVNPHFVSLFTEEVFIISDTKVEAASEPVLTLSTQDFEVTFGEAPDNKGRRIEMNISKL
jgi:hypothetical protein